MQRYKTALKWVGVSIFIFIFHLVYNHFGHGVQSASLNWAWLIPLIPALIRGVLILTKNEVTQRFALQHFWQWSNLAIWSITIWLVLQGILTIAGTGSQYLYGYGIFAVLFWIIGFGGGLQQRSKGN